MLKTSKRQNKAFKSHKKRVFMLSLCLIHGHTCCAVFNYMMKEGIFLLLRSIYPVPHEQRVVQSSACDLGLASPPCVMNDRVQCSTVPLEASGFHLTSFMYISIRGPQHIP